VRIGDMRLLDWLENEPDRAGAYLAAADGAVLLTRHVSTVVRELAESRGDYADEPLRPGMLVEDVTDEIVSQQLGGLGDLLPLFDDADFSDGGGDGDG